MNRKVKIIVFHLIALIGIGLLIYWIMPTNADQSTVTVTDYRDLPVREAMVTEIVDGLDAPWAFTWLPNGNILMTERFGTLRLIEDGVLNPNPIEGVPDVFASGQGGLLDITIHPDFETNNFVYLSYAHGTQEGNRLRVARAKLVDMALVESEVLFEVTQTKVGGQHFGSRFQWLPDATLLFSVGDGGNPPTQYNGRLIREQAQSLAAHLGKVIRINDDGTIPDDNPFNGRPDALPEIWSYGHRNIQGITYDTALDRVVASEHGSKGGDELNIPMAGENYGWPLATYSTEYDLTGTAISDQRVLDNAQDPIAVWTPSIAPSEIVYYTGDHYEQAQGDLFLAAMLLRSNTTIFAYRSSPAGAILRIMTDDDGQVTGQERIDIGEYRVRSVGQGPDGFLYVLTDSTSRQGRPGVMAGKLYRIDSF